MALTLLCRILVLTLAGQHSSLAAASETFIAETETFLGSRGANEVVERSSMSASFRLIHVHIH